MAEILSIPASVVGLLQALELAQNSLNTIRSLKNAPAEAKRIETDLQKAQDIVHDIDKLVKQRHQLPNLNDRSQTILHSQLSGLRSDLDVLKKLIGPHLIQDTGWARLKIRLKWATGLERRLMEVCNRLSTSLQLAVSLHTMYSSHECRTSSIQAQNSLGVVTQTPAASDSGYHASDTQITGSPNGLPIPGADRASDTPQSLVCLSNPPTTSGVSTFVYGSTTVCVDLLSEICHTIHERFTVKEGSLIIPSKRTNWVQSKIHGLLHDIFDGQVENWDSDVSPPQPPDEAGPLRTLQPAGRNPPDPLARSTLLFFLKRISLVEAASFEWLGRNADNDHGLNHDMSLTLLTYQPAGSSNGPSAIESFTRCRLYVALTPTPDRQLKGVIVQFSEISGGQNELWRSLTTFGIHPSNSRVFEYMRNGDVAAVQRLLTLRLIAPNDRDEEGNSLLWHCLDNYTNYDMCELLLREGANPADCNRRGDHALAVLVMNLSIQGEQPSPASLKLIDLLLKYCQPTTMSSATEPTANLQYKCRTGSYFAPAGLIHVATPRRPSSTGFITQLPTLMEKFIQHRSNTCSSCGPVTSCHHLDAFHDPAHSADILDLELADKNGNTALLYSLFYHPVLAVIQTATYLLNAGADIKARNKYGEGALHLLCRRLSACSIPNLSDDVKAGLVELLTRLMKNGCDPLQESSFGYAPIDAAMTPVAWPLFCEAVRQSGRDIKAELKLLDFAAKISWQDSELDTLVEAKIHEFTTRRDEAHAPAILHRYPEDNHDHADNCPNGTATSTTCYLCGGGPDEYKRPEPFDEFYSDIVMELGQGVHMIKYNHDNMQECLWVQQEDSCYPLDYHPGVRERMSDDKLRGRSWRRHVAAGLWEGGLLG